MSNVNIVLLFFSFLIRISIWTARLIILFLVGLLPTPNPPKKRIFCKEMVPYHSVTFLDNNPGQNLDLFATIQV